MLETKTEPMPKPKSKPAAPAAPDTRMVALTVKATPEYNRWLHALAAHCRQSAVGVMDLALVRYAKEVGFKEPPPPRNPVRS